MMARSKIAPLQRPNTLLQLSRSSVLKLRLATRGRAIQIGTFRTSRDVRLESVMRTKADIRQRPWIYEFTPLVRLGHWTVT